MYKVFSKIYDKFMEFSDYGAWEDLINSLILKGEPGGKTLLDIGCGTGELLLRLTKNYECHGMDLSEEMLKIAHKKLKHREVKLFLGDMVDFDTGYTYDIMVSLFDTVNHLVSYEELESHLMSVKKSLKDGGVYIFDVVDRDFMDTMFKGGTFADVRKDITCIWEHEIEDGLDYIDATYFVKNSRGSWDRYQEGYSKKIFERRKLEGIATNVGFEIVTKIIDDKITGKRTIYLLKK